MRHTSTEDRERRGRRRELCVCVCVCLVGRVHSRLDGGTRLTNALYGGALQRLRRRRRRDRLDRQTPGSLGWFFHLLGVRRPGKTDRRRRRRWSNVACTCPGGRPDGRTGALTPCPAARVVADRRPPPGYLAKHDDRLTEST